MIQYRRRHHARSRRVSLTVLPPGEVVVTAPSWIKTPDLDAFVAQHHHWIKKQLTKFKGLALTSHQIVLFGNPYTLRWEAHHGRSSTKIQDQLLVVSTPTQGQAETAIARFLKNTAERYLVPRTHQLAKKMAVTFQRLSLKDTSSRWGSCSSQGNLNFNWRLVHAPPAVIDYVIVHELAHLVHLNHSHQFWQLVKTHHPDFQLHRGWLKRQGQIVTHWQVPSHE